MSFSFRDLDLSGNSIESGSVMLEPGRHVTKITDASITNTKTGGKQVLVVLTAMNGDGSIRDYINIVVPGASADEKKAMSQRIGRDRLKALLHFGGHKNPDNPGDISSMIGLVVGVNVTEDEYEDKEGNKRKGSRVKRGGAYFSPSELGHSGGPSSGGSSRRDDLDDDVPF